MVWETWSGGGMGRSAGWSGGWTGVRHGQGRQSAAWYSWLGRRVVGWGRLAGCEEGQELPHYPSRIKMVVLRHGDGVMLCCCVSIRHFLFSLLYLFCLYTTQIVVAPRPDLTRSCTLSLAPSQTDPRRKSKVSQTQSKSQTNRYVPVSSTYPSPLKPALHCAACAIMVSHWWVCNCFAFPPIFTTVFSIIYCKIVMYFGRQPSIFHV